MQLENDLLKYKRIDTPYRGILDCMSRTIKVLKREEWSRTKEDREGYVEIWDGGDGERRRWRDREGEREGKREREGK